jgi:ABC-2 type transport system permease protein
MLAANLRKLVRRPASWVTLGLLIGLQLLLLLVVIAASRTSPDASTALSARLLFTFPAAYDALFAFLLSFAGLFAVAYGGAIAGSEWGWGTLKGAIARGESRSGYALLGYAAVAIATIVGFVVAFVVIVLVAALAAVVQGVSISGMTDAEALRTIGEELVRASGALAMNTAIGFAIATVARSQMAGVIVGIGVYFVEGIAGLFLPDAFKYAPFAASSALASPGIGGGVSGGGGGGPIIERLDVPAAAIAVGVWLLIALAVSAVWTERAEISG